LSSLFLQNFNTMTVVTLGENSDRKSEEEVFESISIDVNSLRTVRLVLQSYSKNLARQPFHFVNPINWKGFPGNQETTIKLRLASSEEGEALKIFIRHGEDDTE